MTGAIVAVSGNDIAITDELDDTIGWYAHSNCCPGGTADVACISVRGQQSLVLTRSLVLPKGYSGTETPYQLLNTLPPDQLERRWDRAVYRLRGARFEFWFRDDGAVGVDAPAPQEVPLNNRLSCGSARD